jgi:uncharacterized membrane protein
MNVNIFKRVRVFQNSFFLSNLLKMKKPFSFYCSVMNDTKRNISWTSAVMINPVSQSESMTILQDLITELKSYGNIPSVVLLVGVIYTARLIGKLEANITSHKEISSVKHSANKEAAEAKIASAEAKAAANKEAAEAKFASTETIVAANNKAAEAKFASTEAIIAAKKYVNTEISKNAEIAALKVELAKLRKN